MCEPATMFGAASFALGLISSVASMSAQQQQAQAQADYQEAQAREYAKTAELNNKAAIQEYVSQTAAERTKESQEKQSASAEAQAVQREALEKKGTMLASTNAAGGALNMLLADYDRQEGLAKDNIRHQMEMNAVDHQINVETYKDRAQNRINSQQSYVAAGVTKPNTAVGLALGIGQAAFQGFNTWNSINSKGSKNITATGKPGR